MQPWEEHDCTCTDPQQCQHVLLQHAGQAVLLLPNGRLQRGKPQMSCSAATMPAALPAVSHMLHGNAFVCSWESTLCWVAMWCIASLMKTRQMHKIPVAQMFFPFEQQMSTHLDQLVQWQVNAL